MTQGLYRQWMWLWLWNLWLWSLVVVVVVMIETVKLAVVVVVVDETLELAETLHGSLSGPCPTCRSITEFDGCRLCSCG